MADRISVSITVAVNGMVDQEFSRFGSATLGNVVGQEHDVDIDYQILDATSGGVSITENIEASAAFVGLLARNLTKGAEVRIRDAGGTDMISLDVTGLPIFVVLTVANVGTMYVVGGGADQAVELIFFNVLD